MWAVYTKKKMSIAPVYMPSPYNAFLYSLEGQVHKDGVMTNVHKSRLVKVIFTNIHNTSDPCANSFGRYMVAQCMRNVFSFYEIQVS